MTSRDSADDRIAVAAGIQVVSKNISRPSREHALLKKHHEQVVTGSMNVTFPALVKSFSSRKAHHGLGKSTAHRGRSKDQKIKARSTELRLPPIFCKHASVESSQRYAARERQWRTFYQDAK